MGRPATTARRAAACLIGSLAALALTAHSATAAVHVYVSNQGSNSVSVYSIVPSGALSPVTCDPSTSCATGTHPFGVVIDSSGRHLYTGNNQSNSISVFSIGADGALSPVACDPTTSCKTPGGSGPIAIDPLGRYLYGTNNFGDHGSVSVWSIGADGALTPVPCDQTTNCATNGGNPNSLAVDPSGTHVYVGNQLTNSVSVYAIGTDGALSPVSCDPATSCKTGDAPSWITFAPNGKFAYVANGVSSGSVSVFSVAADGSLSPVSCDPTTSCAAPSPRATAIDSSGRHLFTVNDAGDGSVSSFNVEPNGALSPIACSPTANCTTGEFPEGIAIDPIGRHLYVPHFFNDFVSVFGVDAGGAISPVECDKTTSCKTGSDPSTGSIAISPDRGPVATFSASAATATSPSTFEASASSSPDYPITSYNWNFGDGQTQTTSTPTTQHTYATPGTYSSTLTVTDEGGCSTALVFTGQTASCDGSSKAIATQALTVTKAPLGHITKLKLSPSAFFAAPSGPSLRAAKKKRKRRTYGAIVSYVDAVAAKTTFTVQRPAAGRRKGHSCVKPTKRNRKRKHCTRWVNVRGSFAHTDTAGTNRFRFMGRVKRHGLKPGRYRLRAVPVTQVGRGKAVVKRFRIKR